MTSQAACGVFFMAEDFLIYISCCFFKENNITKIYKVYDAYFSPSLWLKMV